MEQIVSKKTYATVQELMDCLKEFVRIAGRPASEVYIADSRADADADSHTAQLIERTLTDGSSVYDIAIA